MNRSLDHSSSGAKSVVNEVQTQFRGACEEIVNDAAGHARMTKGQVTEAVKRALSTASALSR